MNNRLKPYDPDETRRMLILMVMMGVGLLAYHYFYEYPTQRAAQEKAMAEMAVQEEKFKLLEVKQQEEAAVIAQKADKLPKITIEAPEMKGAVTLVGGRIHSLLLNDYKEEAKTHSKPVKLLHPQGSPDAYFVEFGWLSADENVKLPNDKTVWQTNGEQLTKQTPVTLFWENGAGLRFEMKLSLKDEFLFNIEQRVINSSKKAARLIPYGYINRTLQQQATENMVLHEGPIGVMDGALNEVTYTELMEEKKAVYKNAKGWLGISDKYWLTVMVPQSKTSFTGNFKAYEVTDGSGAHRFQIDYMGEAMAIPAGQEISNQTLLFAGAKKLSLLDNYRTKYNIPLFDRAVDLGFLYFLTKPLFHLLHWLYTMVGDFGVAILLLTVCVKGAMYPLANKSYTSMNEMKRLQPRLQKLKENSGTDKVKFNQEMMKLYKEEKINPAAGCLPMLIQMPVFFALYKVLYVTIEMRHAPFFNIIHDLSAPDPTNIFNGFGLIDWLPPQQLHLGIMAILFAVSMWATQQLNAKPTDATQAKIMGFLPWIFMFIMAGFPAGMLLYWIWSNVLSCAQQWTIKFRYGKREKKRDAKLAAMSANDA